MMKTTASAIAQRVWNYAHVLRDEGLGFVEYTEQITYLLFLKLAWEHRNLARPFDIPHRYTWDSLRSIQDNGKLKKNYALALRSLSKKPGLLGLIFTKPQSKIEDPAKLKHLMSMLDNENWESMDVDVKGEIYESLLARNSEEVRGGAGQYFTPRPVIRAIVEVMNPRPGIVISDPACGTGGFLLAAYDHVSKMITKNADRIFLQARALRGTDIVPNVARLCMMNLYLHGAGLDPDAPPINIEDSLARIPQERVSMVLTNPPFGKKSSINVISDGRKLDQDDIAYARDDFWATTRNKQLNFVQHVYSMLDDGGTAAIIVPDNVLFESGAGEKIRRELLARADVHTLLRLPTGIWYAPGVQANVLFFDRRQPMKKELWVYDLRTNKNFTLRKNPITLRDLKDFIRRYNSADRTKRSESSRFKRYKHAEILASEKASLDLIWLNNDLYSDPNTAISHDVLSREVIQLLRLAISEFESAVDIVSAGRVDR